MADQHKILLNFETNLTELTKSLNKVAKLTETLIDQKKYNKSLDLMTKGTHKFSKDGVKSFNHLIEANTRSNAEMRNTVEILKDAGFNMQGLERQTGDLITRMRSFLPYGLAMHFGMNNIARAAFNANQETKDWAKSFNTLSDSTGSTQLAISQMHQAFYMSGGSLSTVQGIMQSLSAQGIPNTTKGFAHMTAWITNMSLASGIGAETLSNFAGTMVRNWKVSIGQTQKMTSSVLAMQKAFNLTASEIDLTMKTVADVVEKTGSFFKDGAKSAIAFTKGISQTVGILSKFGISTQKASEFVSGLLDTDKIGENLGLLNKLGISYQDYIDMLASGDAKENLFDRLMTNLPHVSQQIQNIADPLSRMNFAKSLGLPLEIAQKMAKATTGEINQLMKDYKKSAEADKAMQEKQKRMTEESSRFNETLHLMKRDALQPMMEWINKNIHHFWRGAKIFFDFLKKYVGGLSNVFERGKNLLVPFMDVLEGKGTFPEFMGKLATGLIDAVGDAFSWGFEIIANNFGNIADSVIETFGNVWRSFFDKHPLITTLVSFIAAANIGSKILGGAMDFWNASKGTKMNPLITKDVSTVSGGFLESIFGGKGKGASATVPRTKGMGLEFGGFPQATSKPGLMGRLGGGAARLGGGAARLGMAGLRAVPGLGLGVAVAGGLAGALSGATSAAESFGQETSTWGQKFAGGVSGALQGLTMGIMSEKTQQALTRSLYYMFSGRKQVLEDLNKLEEDLGKRREKNYLISEKEIEREVQLRKLANKEVAISVKNDNRDKQIARGKKHQELEKLKEADAMNVQHGGMSIYGERIKQLENQLKFEGANEFTTMGAFNNKDGIDVGTAYAKKAGISMEVLQHRIAEEHKEILSAYGIGISQRVRKEKELIEKRLEAHNKGDQILQADEKKRLEATLLRIEKAEKTKVDKTNLIERITEMSRAKHELEVQKIKMESLKKGTIEHEVATKKFAQLNKNYGNMVKKNSDISSSLVDSFGATAEGINANMTSLVTGLQQTRSQLSWYSIFGVGEQGNVRDFIKSAEKNLDLATDSFHKGDKDKFRSQKELTLKAIEAAKGASTDQKIIAELQNQHASVTAYFNSLERAEEARKKEAENRKNLDQSLLGLNKGMFGKLKSIDDKTADSRTKTEQREDWLSSMIGFKGNIRIKSGLG